MLGALRRMAWGTPLGRYRWMGCLSLLLEVEGSCSLAVTKKLGAGL